MYVLADKYEIPLLKDFALKRFEACINSDEWYVPGFCGAVKKLYNMDEPLSQEFRELIVTLAVESREQLNEEEEFQTLLLQKPDFMRDVLHATWELFG